MATIRETYDYPENLLRSLNIDDITINDILNSRERLISVEYALTIALREREFKILKMYYENKLSPKEIGEIERCGNKRIYQILGKIHRKIKYVLHKKPYYIITMGVDKYYTSIVNDALEEQEYLKKQFHKPDTSVDE